MNYDELIVHFQKEFQSKNYKGALRYVREATKKDPTKPVAWRLLANLYLWDLNNASFALNALRFALRYHANDIGLLLIHADAEFRLQKYAEAMKTLTKVLELDWEQSQAWDLLDKISFADAKLRPAIEQFRQDFYQKDIERAREFARQNKFPEAIKIFEHAVQVNPSNIDIIQELAHLYHRQGNYGASLNYAQQLYTKRPNDIALLNLLASNYTQMGDLHAAFEHYQISLQKNPSQPLIGQNFQTIRDQLAYQHIHEGDAKFSENDFDGAKKSYQEVLKYLPGDKQILQRIANVQKAIDTLAAQQKIAEDEDFIAFLGNEAQIAEEIELDDLLQQMPKHSDVTDKDTLKGLLKRLLQTKKISGMLTPNTLKFIATSGNQMPGSSKNISKSFQSSHKTLGMKNAEIPVIALREGTQQDRTYKFTVKIQNNTKRSIFQIIVFVYFPQSVLQIQSMNPAFIPQLTPNQVQAVEFLFSMSSDLLEGRIQSIVLYLDDIGEMHTLELSGYEIENLTASMQPIHLDPGSFATVLQASQNYAKEQDSFIIAKSPQEVFSAVQDDLQALHFHIQKAVQSTPDENPANYNGYIYATARPADGSDPVLMDIRIQPEGGNNSKIFVKSSAASQKVSKILAKSVKSSIMMPKCPHCTAVFPLTLYEKIRKGYPVVCEVCGEPSRFPGI
jgi:tetratricopeptide (TPR) repeat protein